LTQSRFLYLAWLWQEKFNSMSFELDLKTVARAPAAAAADVKDAKAAFTRFNELTWESTRFTPTPARPARNCFVIAPNQLIEQLNESARIPGYYWSVSQNKYVQIDLVPDLRTFYVHERGGEQLMKAGTPFVVRTMSDDNEKQMCRLNPSDWRSAQGRITHENTLVKYPTKCTSLSAFRGIGKPCTCHVGEYSGQIGQWMASGVCVPMAPTAPPGGIPLSAGYGWRTHSPANSHPALLPMPRASRFATGPPIHHRRAATNPHPPLLTATNPHAPVIPTLYFGRLAGRRS
jgi:hypothetical protein